MEDELEYTCNFDCNCGKKKVLGMCIASLGLGIVLTGHIMMCKKNYK